MENAFAKTARYYDKIYAWKDYAGEVEHLLALIGARQTTPARTLLDVACGSGLHIEYLKRHFDVEGLDICEELLGIARGRNPEISFHLGDMTAFDLGRQYDVVTCLFSSIGYVGTHDRLYSAMRCMARHLKPGGLIVIEPWFTPDNWHPHTVHALFIDEPELKIARISTSFQDGRRSLFDLHYLIGTPEGTEHVVEHNELGLFEMEEMRRAMEDAGLSVEYDHDGITGRGLYIGTRL